MTDKKNFNSENENIDNKEFENEKDSIEQTNNLQSNDSETENSELSDDSEKEPETKEKTDSNDNLKDSSENTEQKTQSEKESESIMESTDDDQDDDQDDETSEAKLPDYSEKSREELMTILRSLIDSYPEKDVQPEMRYIRQIFEKKTAKHKADLLQEREEKRQALLDSGEEDIELEELPEDELPKQFTALFDAFKQKQKEQKQKEKEQREKNLESKKQIIKNIESLINKPEAFGKTFNEFKAFQKQWDETGSVPKNENRSIWTEYNRVIENFYNYVQINKELRDLDLQKNTKIKTDLCEEAEALTEIEDIMEAQRKLQKLHDRWRETGPVVNELREELWERFKAPTKEINDKHQDRLKLIKDQQEKNLESKTYLCEKAEEALNNEYKSNSEWKKASALVQKYQKLWNSIGYVPKQHNQSIYERFSKACDGFFDRMRQHFESVNEKRMDNLTKKQALLEQALERSESTDWSKDTKFFKNIQNEWKKIGPVPRKHSDKIWKQFRSACNAFFDKKRDHFNQRKEEERKNLELKTQVIQEIEAYEADDKEAALKQIKEFQKAWQEIGFVPIKEKDRIVAEYNTALDNLFEKMDIDKSKKVSLKFSEKIQVLENADEERVWSEIGKLRAKIDEKEKEISLWKNNLGFFANNKNSENMRAEYQERIDRAENEVAEYKAMIKKLENL